MQNFHKELAKGKWKELSFSEQMGNIASEVYRVWSRRKAGDERGSELAFERVLELIDLSMAAGLSVHRLGEIARLREIICDTYLGEGEYNIEPDTINEYLLQFAIKARR